jgi:hypothetical protein
MADSSRYWFRHWDPGPRYWTSKSLSISLSRCQFSCLMGPWRSARHLLLWTDEWLQFPSTETPSKAKILGLQPTVIPDQNSLSNKSSLKGVSIVPNTSMTNVCYVTKWMLTR